MRSDYILFRLPDPGRRYASVILNQEIMRPRRGPELRRRGTTWELRLPRPPVARLEYTFEVTHADGRTEQVCDPGNARAAPGPFEAKSVLELPGYLPPAWLDGTGARPRPARHTLTARGLRSPVSVGVWSSHEVPSDTALPLLVAHDGRDYDRYSSLLTMLSHYTAVGPLPPMRAALLSPTDRNEEYSASAAYARALCFDLLPALQEIAPAPPGRAQRIGMGASLGALAMLHAHRLHPASFGGLFLQSGSFFTTRFDGHEAGLPRFKRIVRFVGSVLSRREWTHPIPVAITCGAVEENLANNRLMAEALRGQGYTLDMTESRDAHNWIAWRDVFYPALVDLLSGVWR